MTPYTYDNRMENFIEFADSIETLNEVEKWIARSELVTDKERLFKLALVKRCSLIANRYPETETN